VRNYFYYACRDHGSGFAAAAAFGANTPLFGTIDATGRLIDVGSPDTVAAGQIDLQGSPLSIG